MMQFSVFIGIFSALGYAVAQPIEARSLNVEIPSFTFPALPTPTYAKGVSGNNSTTTYAPAYSDLSSLVANVSTTTWGSWNGKNSNNATDSDDPYGNHAWTQLWVDLNVTSFNPKPIYSTTVEPTAIPTSSLVLPPEDIFSFDDELKFPKGFVFGVAGSAAQIEGAIAEHGRTPSFLESPSGWVNSSKPQDYVTNENYYLYKQDIARFAAMGVETYSFTIPWGRILPFTLKGSPVNQEGIDHYDDLINTCIQYGVKPMITLNHFDNPVVYTLGKNLTTDFYLNGGYEDENYVEDFVNYGKIVMTHFADRVPIWVTFNEPYLVAGTPLGIKNVINAHSQLYKFYHNDIKGTGKVGMKLMDGNGFPLDPTNQTDIEAAKRFNSITVESFGFPLTGKQQPEVFRSIFAGDKGLFSDEEISEVANTLDFLGIDPYTVEKITAGDIDVKSCLSNSSNAAWPLCSEQGSTEPNGWAIGYRSQSYVYITPVQIRTQFNYLWDSFQVPIFITEFGFPEWREGEKELKDQLFDQGRSIYYRSYMDAILKAIHFDGVDIMGATAWSFADNWEFGDYEQQFGLQVVNRTTQERYYKKSFFDYVKYYQDRKTK